MFPNAQTPRPPSFNESDMADKPAFMQGLPLFGPSDIAGMDTFRRKQLQSIQAVDEGIAAVVQTLQTQGKLDNTYIIFTSDNGLHAGQHRFPIGKGAAFEEDVRVPLMVRGPGVPAGVVRSELVSMVDIVPTLADLGGANMTIEVDGRSLVPLLHTTAPPAQGWRKAVLIEHWPQPSSFVTDPHPMAEPPDPGDLFLHRLLYGDQAATAYDRAATVDTPDWTVLRTADYKYVRRVGNARELYDIDQDRYELYSQHADADAAFLSQLNTRLNALYTCAGAACRSLEELDPPVFSLRYARADMNRDNRVDLTDVIMATDCWRQPVVGSCGDRFDMTYDGVIDVVDIMQVVAAWTGSYSSETAQAAGRLRRVSLDWLLLGLLWLIHAIALVAWLRLDNRFPAGEAAVQLTTALRVADALGRPSLDVLSRVAAASAGQPPLYYLATAPLIWLGGRGPDSATLLNLAWLALLMASVYSLTRRLFPLAPHTPHPHNAHPFNPLPQSVTSSPPALAAAALVSLYPLVIAYTRIYDPALAVGALAALAIWLLVESDGLQRRPYAIGSGPSYWVRPSWQQSRPCASRGQPVAPAAPPAATHWSALAAACVWPQPTSTCCWSWC